MTEGKQPGLHNPFEVLPGSGLRLAGICYRPVSEACTFANKARKFSPALFSGEVQLDLVKGP